MSKFNNSSKNNLIKIITPEDKAILQQIARDQVIEPFEGRKSLETIQKTRSGLEKGVLRIKSVTKKAGKAIKDSKVYEISKNRISQVTKKTSDISQSGFLHDLMQRLNDATDDFQTSIKKHYKDVEEKARKISVTYTRKGLEFLLYEDTESWIIKRANSVLKREDLNTIDKVRELNALDRKQLIDELYPYNSPNFKSLMKTFETSLNVTLGAVVASNIPGTGIGVSIINMAKTLVKLGHRINIMSAIYGYRISSPQSLFKASAMILKSMDDWENNPDHSPIDFQILDQLYLETDEDSESSFYELMEAIVRKDAYIAIPGVGMISLGKINLDDMKIDIVVQNLVENYFNYNHLTSVYTEEEIDRVLHDYRLIYAELLKVGYHKHIRKNQEDSKLTEQEEGRWKTRLKLFARLDLDLKGASTTLDQFASELYSKIESLPDTKKQQFISLEIKQVLAE